MTTLFLLVGSFKSVEFFYWYIFEKNLDVVVFSWVHWVSFRMAVVCKSLMCDLLWLRGMPDVETLYRTNDENIAAIVIYFDIPCSAVNPEKDILQWHF